ncbi:GntR family transcriptional regulator [Kitasatospora atroaurantiaca]|uniref:Winged helix-turn helix protein n=1 Tax=Kitasatospora atroaurantiaca TaxID=285545 RepID=A0A561EK08_9ACTN|nr:GntR family transcriptional regulator [Kitasatospora atroaurantiaca]TWE15944.1 winged helix-turn helix protein [Kitasatospora atroaurantiaca]
MPEQQETSRAATYRAIARDLGDEIRAGRIPPGRNLPSERELAGRYRVNRQTVRAALQYLRAQGQVASDRLGTYVLARHAGRPVQASLSRRREASFPGSFLRPGLSAVAVGWLGEGVLDPCTAEAFEVPRGTVVLTYGQQLRDADGHILQSSLSCFAPALLDRVPQLAAAVEAVGAGGGADPAELGDLFVWGAMAGLRLYRTDRVQVLLEVGEPEASAVPGFRLVVRRTVADQCGQALIVTCFQIGAEYAELTYRDGDAGLPGGPSSPETETDTGAGADIDPVADAARPSAAERAALESWALPSAPNRGLALRARIVLGCETATAEEVARRLGQSRAVVAAWRDRFRAGGVQALELSPRRGRSARARR